MKEMKIAWKRLIKDGETYARCGDTGNELQTAVIKLTDALKPLEIIPVLETQNIDKATLKTNTESPSFLDTTLFQKIVFLISHWQQAIVISMTPNGIVKIFRY